MAITNKKYKEGSNAKLACVRFVQLRQAILLAQPSWPENGLDECWRLGSSHVSFMHSSRID